MARIAHKSGLDHPERVTLYVNNWPGRYRVFGYSVLTDGSEQDWDKVCLRIREWERDPFWKNVFRICKQ